MLRRRSLSWLTPLALATAALVGCDGGAVRPPSPTSDFPKIVSFTAQPLEIAPLDRTTLTWKVDGADSVEIQPDVLTPRAAPEGSIETVPLETTTTFTLRATNAAGETVRRLTVTVLPPDRRVSIARFEATPDKIAPGGTTTLSWATMNATAVRLRVQGGADLVPMAEAVGSVPVQLGATGTFELVAEGVGGPVSRAVTVVVGGAPTVEEFTASAAEVQPGQPATLSWRTSGAMRVTIFDGMQALTTSTEPVGSFEVRPSATTEYRLAAESDVATTDARLTVRVAGAERPRIRSFSVDPITIVGEGAVTVAWDSERADSLLLEANGDVVPNFPSSPTGSLGLRVSTTTTFRLVARNVAGDAVAEQLVTVTPIPDGTPPVLDHTPPGASVVDGASVTLDVGVTDAESGVGMVSVQHRVRGEAGFTTAPMTPRGGRWVVDLPAAAVRAPGLEYAFEALDRAATPNRARLPAMPAELFTLDVVAPDLTPPTITVAPIANGQLAGRPITIRATVRDAASGVGSVTLYHRAAGAPTYTSRVMMPGAADEYTADIPAAAVVVGTVEYYVSAADGAVPTNRASFPSGAPATALSFTVVSIDQTPPVIQHVPVPNAQTAGGAVPVAAQVVDASGVARVTLFFRTIGAGAYTSVALVDGGGNFSGQIPASAVSPPGVEYYLEAADLAPASNVARAPSSAPATPYTFTAQVADTTPPSITHAAQATPQAPGTALVVRATVTDASPLASVTLFYRRAGQPTFQSLAMTGAPMASATIPASEVEPPGLEYYLRAQDAAPAMNVAAAPASAPQTTFAVPVGVAEVEPNQTTASALALLPAGRLETVGLGAISPTADRDLWMLDVPTGAQRYNVRLETTSGGVGSCPSPIATTLRLYASDGTTQLAVDSTDGVNSCSLLDPAVDAGVRALAPGRYFVRVEENGDNAVIAAYELRVRLSLPACGNGILEPSGPEQCDDANQASGDGCSATCTIEPEGVIAAPGGTFAGDISPAGDADLVAVDVPAGSFLRAELTDAAGTGCPGDLYLELYGLDGVTLLGQDDDDGTGSCSLVNPLTDTWARALPAGRYFLRVRAFSASAMIMGWVLRVSALPTLCGNGVRESGEQCDDNNLTANDGCSATCAFESAGAFSMTGGSASESITPIGNRDFFQVTVQAGESLRAETSAPTPGTCTTGVDTVLRFWNADRTTELTSDDEGGVGSCSLLDPAASAALRGLAAGTYWVSVEDRGNNGTIAGYTLSITLRAPGCGSGVLDAGEQCDDGNTTPNDGCSATCQLEGNGELEPNDTRATATPLLTGGATSGVILGSGQSASDVDVYSVDVPAGSSLFAEVSDGQGGCPSGTALRLVGPTGTSLVFDTDGGPGSCGQISPSRHVAARALAAGLYTLEVSGASSPAVYRLEVRLTAPGCGDFALAAAEACDDGNTTSGDGCSATCALEGRAELEPNDTSMTAQTLTLTATGAEVRGVLRSSFDVDTFRVAVPAGSTLIAELSDGAGRCPNAAGLRMAPTTGFTGGSDASSGYGSCGRISPGLQAWIRVIPSGDQFVQVYAPTPSTTTAVYVLTVRVVPLATCGNGYWESGEQCDDGNTTSGDGCSATCSWDVLEQEPNNGSMAAQALTGASVSVSGSLGAGDEDWFAVTVPEGGSIEAFSHRGARDQCLSTGLDTVLSVHGPGSATQLAEDDDGGPDTCSWVEPSAAQGLAAGTYFVRIRPYGSAITSYGLTIVVRPR